MYILAGKKKLADVRANELQQAMDKAKVSGLPEDCLLYTSNGAGCTCAGCPEGRCSDTCS